MTTCPVCLMDAVRDGSCRVCRLAAHADAPKAAVNALQDFDATCLVPREADGEIDYEERRRHWASFLSGFILGAKSR